MPAGSGEMSDPRAPLIAAVVLAAGRSSRMGPHNKLLADIGGKPMVCQVVETALASKARPVLVVTGHQAAEVAAALEGLWASQMEQGAGPSVPSPRMGEGQGGGRIPDYFDAFALCAGVTTVSSTCVAFASIVWKS